MLFMPAGVERDGEIFLRDGNEISENGWDQYSLHLRAAVTSLYLLIHTLSSRSLPAASSPLSGTLPAPSPLSPRCRMDDNNSRSLCPSDETGKIVVTEWTLDNFGNLGICE